MAIGAIDAVLILSRTSVFISVCVLAGSLIFVLFVWPNGRRSKSFYRVFNTSWMIATATTIGSVGIYGANAVGDSLLQSFSPRLINAVLHSDIGYIIILRLIALLTVMKLVNSRFRRSDLSHDTVLPIVVCIALITATLSIGSHAGESQWYAYLIDVVHLLAAFTWIGGLINLWHIVLPRRPISEIELVVPRFATIAFSSVCILVTTGFIQAMLRLGSVSQLFNSHYGTVLCYKIAAIILIVGTAAVSRSTTKNYFKTTNSPVDEVAMRVQLRNSVRAEAVIAFAILTITAWLVGLDPPKSI